MIRFCKARFVVGLTVAVALFGSAAGASAATGSAACGPLWSANGADASVTGAGQQDQLDIVSGGISNDGSTLTTTLTLKNLSTSVPPGATANEYYFVFPAGGAQYYTNVEVSALGVSYAYGTYDPTTGYSATGTAGGTFKPGPNGTVTVTVPLSGVGSPSGTLSAGKIFGETDQLVGAPLVGGATSTVDNDPATHNYTMGSCASAAPGSSGLQAVAGNTAFANYGAPPGYQNRDLAQRNNAGEPSIGANWKTGNIMYMAGTQISRIAFNTSASPPTAKWTDVTPAEIATASEDSILYTDSFWGGLNRTWAEDFLVFPGCNANVAFTDNDGGSAGLGTDWSPGQCPYAQGPDHPSLGAGPYAGTPPSTSTYSRAVYYCAQNVLSIAGAECSRSDTGGQTWNPPSHLFGAGTPCQAIHGHIRVSPDGTVYVPQDNCTDSAGIARQGMAVSKDNGASWTYSVVPDATARANNTGTDPSVAADAGNNVYFGYEAANGHPMIAVSHDHGKTWSPSTDAGAPSGIHVSVFPEVIGGDAGRAAFAFLGTTTAETSQASDQSASFPGVWYLYVSFTYDGGKTWHTVNAAPNDPVQRGCVWNGGGSNPCRNMLDFNDITIDKTGHVYVAYTDGCTKDPSTGGYNCETNPAINSSGCGTSEGASEYSTATCTYGRQSSVVRQVCGQGLITAFDPGFSDAPGCPGSSSSTSTTSSSTSTSTSTGQGGPGQSHTTTTRRAARHRVHRHTKRVRHRHRTRRRHRSHHRRRARRR